MKIAVTFEAKGQIVDGNSGSRSVGRIADSKAVTQGAKHLFDRVWSGIGPAELGRFIVSIGEVSVSP